LERLSRSQASVHQQVDEPEREPAQAQELRLPGQVEQQIQVDDHADRGYDQPGEHTDRRVGVPATEVERDHAHVHGGEGQERAEVDQRDGALHVEGEPDEPGEAADGDADRGGAEPRLQVREDLLRQHPVAAHRVEQPRHAGLRGDPQRELGDHEPGQEDRGEQVGAATRMPTTLRIVVSTMKPTTHTHSGTPGKPCSR
jgi:hypothetical protein